jgi:hypothetical protein
VPGAVRTALAAGTEIAAARQEADRIGTRSGVRLSAMR